jgi:hypothetical protein
MGGAFFDITYLLFGTGKIAENMKLSGIILVRFFRLSFLVKAKIKAISHSS